MYYNGRRGLTEARLKHLFVESIKFVSQRPKSHTHNHVDALRRTSPWRFDEDTISHIICSAKVGGLHRAHSPPMAHI
jgi:hypothetical protein